MQVSCLCKLIELVVEHARIYAPRTCASSKHHDIFGGLVVGTEYLDANTGPPFWQHLAPTVMEVQATHHLPNHSSEAFTFESLNDLPARKHQTVRSRIKLTQHLSCQQGFFARPIIVENVPFGNVDLQPSC